MSEPLTTVDETTVEETTVDDISEGQIVSLFKEINTLINTLLGEDVPILRYYDNNLFVSAPVFFALFDRDFYAALEWENSVKDVRKIYHDLLPSLTSSRDGESKVDPVKMKKLFDALESFRKVLQSPTEVL